MTGHGALSFALFLYVSRLFLLTVIHGGDVFAVSVGHSVSGAVTVQDGCEGFLVDVT